ncbi:SPN1-like protein [Mya arenaria]|uniref:Snurportin-1 n=1 Tax=Mya arenaria TaxID=6604 RepID=A0ABY7DSS6_MYAAR|nr:SPN1-like protein [Mya arenaria]
MLTVDSRVMFSPQSACPLTNEDQIRTLPNEKFGREKLKSKDIFRFSPRNKDMDELAESLATSFSVSSDPNSTDAPHPRFSEYKKKTSNSDQEARRKNILEQQKERRFDYAYHARRLLEDDWQDSDDLEDDEGDAMELMLSEWLVEVPQNFEKEWMMGTTTAYGRNGYRVNSFPSHLPGGNRRQKDNYKDNAILDCIYHEVEKTFYVLDIMNWKNHPVYDSDTDFRFFWMMSKLQEVPELGEISKLNPYKFIPLQYHDCQKETLTKVFESATQQFDGCLFYHRQAHYTFGRSPLVVWLKPYMVSEMLGLEVPPAMMEQKPANYTTYQQHLTQVKETRERQEKEKTDRLVEKKARRMADRAHKFKMDVSGGGDGQQVQAQGENMDHTNMKTAGDTG